MSFIDIQLKTDIFLSYNSNSLISVLLYNSSLLSDSSTTFSGLLHVIEPQPQDIDISRIKHTFAPSCCTHFAAVLQQLRTYFRFRFLQQQLWFQLVAVWVSQPCTNFRINVLWGWNCNIKPYSCLIMSSSYVEFNAPDVEGSLPGYFTLSY